MCHEAQVLVSRCRSRLRCIGLSGRDHPIPPCGRTSHSDSRNDASLLVGAPGCLRRNDNLLHETRPIRYGKRSRQRLRLRSRYGDHPRPLVGRDMVRGRVPGGRRVLHSLLRGCRIYPWCPPTGNLHSGGLRRVATLLGDLLVRNGDLVSCNWRGEILVWRRRRSRRSASVGTLWCRGDRRVWECLPQRVLFLSRLDRCEPDRRSPVRRFAGVHLPIEGGD